MSGADFTLDPEVFDRDETFEYTVSWKWEDEGDGWEDYTYEWWIEDEFGSHVNSLGHGEIVVDPVQNWITFALDSPPYCGRYTAKCRVTHSATEKTRILFQHPVIIV